MTSNARPTAPRGLDTAGKRLWKSIVDDLPDHLELTARELVILTTAARQADTNAALERAITTDGVIVAGSKDQKRLNACVTELRQGRIAVSHLLGQIDLSDSSSERTAASRRAKNAADIRWAQHAGRRARRG